MQIAIIGMGEVGRCFAAALHAAGHELLLYELRPSVAAEELAASLHRTLAREPGPELNNAEWSMSCVTGMQAIAVVECILPKLSPKSAIADFTTASPATKRKAATDAQGFGVDYVDTAIMGAISLGRERTPLLVSGDRAPAFKLLMDGVGGRVKVINGGAAGDAMSLKILRSVFTKGMEALAVELLMSAEKQGLRAALYEQLQDIDESPLQAFLEMLVRTHVIHARRRLHEVREADRELKAQGIRSCLLSGVADRFQQTAEQLEKHELPIPDPNVEVALTWLLSRISPPARA